MFMLTNIIRTCMCNMYIKHDKTWQKSSRLQNFLCTCIYKYLGEITGIPSDNAPKIFKVSLLLHLPYNITANLRAENFSSYLVSGGCRHTTTHCNALQHTATLCNTMQHIATHCKTLHHHAAHCSTPQHTASLGKPAPNL